ncbi:MAG TPA: 4Fe-4S binding protein [bacterium]|nr:4Fe-4S binding protein [bacterium]
MRGTAGHPDVAVLLCADLGRRVELSALRGWLQQALPGVAAHVVPSLCAQRAEFARALRGVPASRLVLGVCAAPSEGAYFQARLRRADRDPLAVEVVDLGRIGRLHAGPVATETAKVLLAGAVAKLRAFSGARPEQLKPVRPAAVSRRAMLTWSVFEYQVVPSVDAGRCRADRGCRLCVDGCPRRAMEADNGAITVRKSDCISCGVCVTACPYDAVAFPGATAAQVGAQIAALLSAPASLWPRGILFTCRHSPALDAVASRGLTYPPNWLLAEVPCVAMIPPAWMLAPLAMNAAAVALVPCGDDGARGEMEAVRGRVEYCREVLRRCGEGDDRIRLLPEETHALADALRDIPAPAREGPEPAAEALFAAAAASQVLLQLAGRYGAPGAAAIAHPSSPFGVVDVGEACTVCGACADACPTDALRVVQEATESVLAFTPSACVACGRCVPRCPEPHTLRLRQVTDLRRLAAGPVDLRRTRTPRCEACGAPIAPEAMLRRVTAILGRDGAAAAAVITRYCASCRGTAPPMS